MKRTIYTIVGAVAMTGLLLSGCAKDDSLTEITTPEENITSETTDPVIKALSAIPGISGVELKYNETHTDSAYYFLFTQPVDHYNPQRGTYKQQAALRFKGFDNNMVVYTNGYSMDEGFSGIRDTDMRQQVNGNQLNIEHRYFGKSMPENQEDLKFTYFNADQQAHDIHALCSALKPLFKNGKWISTGTSKDGITTALQAYYSDQNGWHDIDVYIPFCAPFLPGTDLADGTHTPLDTLTGVYKNRVCGSGYPAGSDEAKAFERIQKTTYYICTNKAIRDAVVSAFYVSSPEDYAKILEQYENKDAHSTGDLEKDKTAFAVYAFENNAFFWFSHVPFTRWAKYVPDPVLLASDEATKADFDAFKAFIVMDQTALEKWLEEKEKQSGSASDGTSTRAGDTTSLWDFLQLLRKDSSNAYELQSYKELGISFSNYSLVDGNNLTSQQAFDVTSCLALKFPQGVYTHDNGVLMKNFRQWCYTETSQPILFVYSKNDPWTGGAPDDAAFRQNPTIQKVVDPIGVHHDAFKQRERFTLSTEQTIIDFLKTHGVQ